MNSTRPLLALALATASCSAGCITFASREEVARLEADVARLETVRADRRRELDKILAEVRTQQCRSQRAKIDAEVVVRRVTCLKEQATYESCVARNQARASKSGFLGCLLGLGAAVASGGAAAPYALAGCASGAAVGAAIARECGTPPACLAGFNLIQQQVLREAGLAEAPRCE